MMMVVVLIPLGGLESEVTTKGGRAASTYWEPARRPAADEAEMMAPSPCGGQLVKVWGDEGEMGPPRFGGESGRAERGVG